MLTHYNSIVADPKDGPFGIPNQGLTCFVNTSLQFIFTTLVQRPLRDLNKPLSKRLMQFYVDRNIEPLLNYLRIIFPEKRITEMSGDVNSLVEDIFAVLNNEDPKYMDYYKIRSHGECECTSPKYEFKQSIFVLPLCTYKELDFKTDLNSLIGQWQSAEDTCPECFRSVKLVHELPKCLMILIEDEYFEPRLYKKIQIGTQNYELVSFTMHHGSALGGHETCAALRNGEWHLFDDSRYGKFDADNARQYVRLLMYVEKDNESSITMPSSVKDASIESEHEVSDPIWSEPSLWTKFTSCVSAPFRCFCSGWSTITFLNKERIRCHWNYYWAPIYQRIVISNLEMIKEHFGTSFIGTKMSQLTNYAWRKLSEYEGKSINVKPVSDLTKEE